MEMVYCLSSAEVGVDAIYFLIIAMQVRGAGKGKKKDPLWSNVSTTGREKGRGWAGTDSGCGRLHAHAPHFQILPSELIIQVHKFPGIWMQYCSFVSASISARSLAIKHLEPKTRYYHSYC